MEANELRAKVRGLAEDWSWLESHCLKTPELAPQAAQLRMAAALSRNVVGLAVEGVGPKPLFLAVVGGAGAGKSTVINFLAGAVVAEANPQAGYTRHPTAFLPARDAAPWPTTLGFLGPLGRVSEQKPANVDDDIYQVRRIPESAGASPLTDFVLWDCPDMTTWASTGYVSRLMEIVGLADVVVYVASDERYNDEVPTQFLQHVIQAGKAVVVALTKMREADAEALTAHFRQEVLGKLPPEVAAAIPCVSMPQMPPEMRSDPAGKGAKYRVALLNQLLVLCPDAASTRDRTVANAVAYLQSASEGLLEVGRCDLTELDAWKNLVEAGRGDFEERYSREFLSGESFRRFDRTREQVLEMLELPGPGKFLSATLALLRLPYKYARDFLLGLLARPEMPTQPERTIFATALSAWLDSLQAEALRRSSTHPTWKQISHGFDAGFKSQTLDQFETLFRDYEAAESDELDNAAKAVPDRLAGNVILLNTVRILVVAFDIAMIVILIYWLWIPSLYQLLLIPLAVSLTRQVVEWGVRQVIEFQRSQVRNRRMALVRDKLSQPLGKRLIDWPSSGGTTLQKLQQVLQRIPETIRDLASLVKPKSGGEK
ncbi:MAG: GTPase domain-containing protein [Fimbriiglobus sp.]